MSYDRNHGGWRGPVGHLAGDTSFAMRTGWPQPAGRLCGASRRACCRNGAWPSRSRSISAEAKLGWIERAGGATGGGQYLAPAPCSLSDSWLGPGRAITAPPGGCEPAAYGRRCCNVGDLVMVEPQPATPDSKTPVRSDRLLLRQIPEVQGAIVYDGADKLAVWWRWSGGWSFEASQFNRATQARAPARKFVQAHGLPVARSKPNFSPSQKRAGRPVRAGPDVGRASGGPNNFEHDVQRADRRCGLRSSQVAQPRYHTAWHRQSRDGRGSSQNAMAFHVVDQHEPRYLPAALGAVETTVLRQASALYAMPRAWAARKCCRRLDRLAFRTASGKRDLASLQGHRLP